MPLTVAEYLAHPTARADHRLHYADHPSCFGELFLPPATPPYPVVITIHGGCWSEPYGLAPLSGLGAALRSLGIASWNLEYRRLGDGGGWPATFHDVAAGADLLRTVAPRFELDPTRVVALGHSAGGHLAAWLGARARLEPASEIGVRDPLRLKGVVALAGLVDLIEGARRGLCGAAIPRLLGGDPVARPERYAQASPLAMLPLGVPLWHVVGEADDLVPADYVRDCAARGRAHDETHLEVLAGAGHFEPPLGLAGGWEAITTALRSLGMTAG